MADLFWPGDERAGDLFTESALLRAMVRVESAWLTALVGARIAPVGATADLEDLVTDDDVEAVALGAEGGGNPLIPLLPLVRDRLVGRRPVAATWLHKGLTSQDVVDTALMLCVRDVADRLRSELTTQTNALARLAHEHRATVMAGRTLTQHAVPITFGLKAAQWLQGVLDAADALAGTDLPAQVGGAAGTLSAVAELAARTGHSDPAHVSVDLVDALAVALGLHSRPPWHTARSPVSRIGDVLVQASDAFGRIANDVLVLTRPEISELAEPAAAGRGSSSAMPQKTNPVLSVLIRRAALAAPAVGAQLHLAAASAVDERPDGAWHLEWAALRDLGRRTVVAASQTTELVSGLFVDVARMRTNTDAARHDLLAEKRSLGTLFPDPGDERGDERGDDPSSYVGASALIIDAVLERARPYLEEAR
jgi:3-carboxy-cis,cis-muconate cycloisomerase